MYIIRPVAGIRPAGQTGLPAGPIVQTGSSVSPTFIAVTIGLVAAAGALAFVLTQPVPDQYR